MVQIRSLEIVRSSGEPSDSPYEFLTLEVLKGAEPIVVVDREKGFDFLEAEVFGIYKGYGSGTKVPLDDLIEALIEVRKTFGNMNKIK